VAVLSALVPLQRDPDLLVMHNYSAHRTATNPMALPVDEFRLPNFIVRQRRKMICKVAEAKRTKAFLDSLRCALVARNDLSFL
jgi:hypothetical protein